MARKRVNIILKCLRTCQFTVPLVGALSSGILYFFSHTNIPAIFITTLIAWLASDVLIHLFIKGGNGAVHLPIFGNKTTFKGYGFLMFFTAILVVSIILNALNDKLTEYLSGYLSVWYFDVLMGFALAGLVFVDLNAKYYTHDN